MANPKPLTSRYDRALALPVSEVLPIIEADMRKPEKGERTVIDGIAVHTTSIRLRTFALTGVACRWPGCKLVGRLFAFERNIGDQHTDKPYHLNLWAIDEHGEQVLMTHDHIISRANGGADHLDNTETMCQPHNNAKGQHEYAPKPSKVNPAYPKVLSTVEERKMSFRGYRTGVEWIALNIRTGEEQTVDDIMGYSSICLLAEVMGKHKREVARDVHKTRHQLKGQAEPYKPIVNEALHPIMETA